MEVGGIDFSGVHPGLMVKASVVGLPYSWTATRPSGSTASRTNTRRYALTNKIGLLKQVGWRFMFHS
jgi:hypothetical protein